VVRLSLDDPVTTSIAGTDCTQFSVKDSAIFNCSRCKQSSCINELLTDSFHEKMLIIYIII